jgi:elongation factor Ts
VSTTTLDINDIKWLREETGAGIMDAKKALQDTGGDRGKALRLLEQRGAAKHTKLAGRTAGQGLVTSYIHHGGQVGVLVELNSETDFTARTPEFHELAREVAMQIAAHNPRYGRVEDIPESEARALMEGFREEAVKSGKEKAADKIAEGKFRKYSEQNVLLEQPYIRDDKRTIKQLVQSLGAKTGENIQIGRFARFQIGE